MSLAELARTLTEARGVDLKREIIAVAAQLPHAPELPWLAEPGGRGPRVHNGDDAAAIPDGDGHLLLAAEGMLPSFVASDPYFAGFCSVMVNVSDILAMGGRPYAVVDVLFGGAPGEVEALLAGMGEAAARFGVPVVGGHTGRSGGSGTYLAVAIVGRARALLESRAARPSDVLIAAVDLAGAYHGEQPFFDAATCAPAARLRDIAALLPALAEAGIVHAAKDVSMAGFLGTLSMFCEASGTGARLDLAALPRPSGVELARWLVSFPSFGFLLAARPEHAAEVCRRFQAAGIASAVCGSFDHTARVRLAEGAEEALYWDLASRAFTGFSAEKGGC